MHARFTGPDNVFRICNFLAYKGRCREKAAMALYRLYWIGRDGHIWAAQNVDCADDEQAKAYAADRLGEFTAIEVWLGARRVTRIDAPDKRQRR